MFNYACTTKSGMEQYFGIAMYAWMYVCLAFTLIELDLLNEAISISLETDKNIKRKKKYFSENEGMCDPYFCVKNCLVWPLDEI